MLRENRLHLYPFVAFFHDAWSDKSVMERHDGSQKTAMIVRPSELLGLSVSASVCLFVCRMVRPSASTPISLPLALPSLGLVCCLSRADGVTVDFGMVDYQLYDVPLVRT